MRVDIRQASLSDLGTVSDILREAAAWLEARGMPMWHDNELVPQRLTADVTNGAFFIAECDGAAAGTIKFELEDPLFWPDLPPGEAAFVHRLAVRRHCAGGAVSTALLCWAAERAAALGRRYLRLDCEASRPQLRAIYERFGFRYHSDRQVGPYRVSRYEIDFSAAWRGQMPLVYAPEMLTTARLVLRRPRAADAAAVYAYASDPEVTRYMDWPRHRDACEAADFAQRCAARWECGEEFCWVITVRPDERAIGAVACRIRGPAADFGYVLNRHFWQRGYATEAARTVLAWAMGLPQIYRVWATCDAENVASVRVLEKLGLTRECTLGSAILRPNISACPRDAFLYAKVRGPGWSLG